MELLYLLCSLLSTSITTIALSLLLPFRLLLSRFGFQSKTNDSSSVSLYEGTVWHQRRHPVHHSFRYPVRYALIDLDNVPNPPPDHLSAHKARSLSGTNGPVLLLTIPPSVGYVQNPLSLYYCYDVDGSLNKCIAEVTNTPWGERVSFMFNPNSDVVAKALHVSPFMDMLGNWTMKTNTPGDNLFVTISVNHPKHGDYFSASLMAKRVSSSMDIDLALFFWLMPHKVALWIYWQALQLWWKGVPFLQHPRYYNSKYRGEAILFDEKLQCCPAFACETPNNQQAEEQFSSPTAQSTSKHHSFTWRDAKWPWC